MNISIFLQNSQVSAWTMTEKQADIIRKNIPEAQITLCPDKGYFRSTLIEADVAIGWYFEQEWLDAAKSLKVLATPAAGKDYFKVKLPPSIKLLNGTFHGKIMAQTSLGMMLAHCRRIIDSDNLMKSQSPEDKWPRHYYDGLARTLYGSQIVILGFGAIGKEAGRLAKLMGATITGVNRSNFDRPDYFQENDKVLPVENLAEALPTADHILLVLPSTNDSDDLIDKRSLSLLKNDVGIYNIGRGNCIEENALLDFLRENPAAAAYLDVFKQEPLAENSPLRVPKNLHLMPHASAIAPEYLELFAHDFCQQINALGLTERIIKQK